MKSRVPVLAFLLALIALVAAACGSPSPTGGQWFFGESLAINLIELHKVPEVRYTHEEKQWVVRPKDEANELVAGLLTVRNRSSSLAILSINERSLRLTDMSSTDYHLVDPFTQREEAPDASGLPGGASPILDRYVPFIWGSVDLPQECYDENSGQMQGCELKGWVLFETPKGRDLRQLVWETSDVVYLYFKQ